MFLEVIGYFSENPQTYQLKELFIGETISLGNLHVEIVPYLGHTKGSVGFWVLEERLLIAGNALNEGLWLFNYGALSMAQLYQTLQNTIRLDFDTYLGGHSSEEYPKESCLRIFAISRI